MRLDGFVSAQAPISGGELVTKPIKMSGKTLRLNFASSAAGQIRVEIQSADGGVIPGFALADCQEVFGDEIDRIVKWKSSDVSSLAGKPIRLRFRIQDADLFAYRFA